MGSIPLAGLLPDTIELILCSVPVELCELKVSHDMKFKLPGLILLLSQFTNLQ